MPAPLPGELDDADGGAAVDRDGGALEELPEGFDPKTATSLNHACTLLSERYETHRMSHTLNVYQHVFYQEHEATNDKPHWRPLDALRNGVIADMERSILSDAWRKLEEQLGFRPIGTAAAKPHRRKR